MTALPITGSRIQGHLSDVASSKKMIDRYIGKYICRCIDPGCLGDCDRSRTNIESLHGVAAKGIIELTRS